MSLELEPRYIVAEMHAYTRGYKKGVRVGLLIGFTACVVLMGLAIYFSN